jgi:hypothetical protein
MSFKINTDDKPFLTQAMRENPEMAKEVIRTFVGLMEEAFDTSKGITWAELPKKLHKDLSFSDLINGILRGSLDLNNIHPEGYAVLREEIHPLAMLQKRKNYLDGTTKYPTWRAHFDMPEDAEVNEKAVSDIFRKLLRYGRYVKIDDLRKAMESNQIAAFRGLGDEQIAKLPFTPALRYQREHFGELQVGKFMDDYGVFDCGKFDFDQYADGHYTCPACWKDTLVQLSVAPKVRACESCNAGFVQE